MDETNRADREKLIAVFLDWNSKINLSAIRDADGVREKHILDSLELVKIVDIDDWLEALDLWTWGGFPLLPLAMMHPNVKRTGIDARKKKVDVVNTMIAELWLTNAHAIWWRIEEQKKQYDLITTRAVAYADQLFSRALPRLRSGWLLAMYKMFTSEEDETILSLMRHYRLKPIALHHYRLEHDLPEVQRVLYVLQKW
jgi:16S rRNA (guanine(527)-N(7))-methyltransferase RsmG